MLRILFVIAALGPATAALAAETGFSQTSEAAAVMEEACGTSPSLRCVEELRKVCHGQLTLRCYYSRKARLDAVRHVGFPADGHHPLDD